jgi:hypothetical protein
MYEGFDIDKFDVIRFVAMALTSTGDMYWWIPRWCMQVVVEKHMDGKL